MRNGCDARLDAISTDDLARELLNRARNCVAWERIGIPAAEDGEDSEAVAIAQVLDRTLAQVRGVLSHSCEWSENDYCVTCGADGRA